MRSACEGLGGASLHTTVDFMSPVHSGYTDLTKQPEIKPSMRRMPSRGMVKHEMCEPVAGVEHSYCFAVNCFKSYKEYTLKSDKKYSKPINQ